MISEECTVVIAGLLMGLNVIDYTISLSGEDFDKSVSYHLLLSVTDHTPIIQSGVLDLSLFLKDGNYLEKAPEGEEEKEQ